MDADATDGGLGDLAETLSPATALAFPVTGLLFFGAWAYLAAWLGNVQNAGLLYVSVGFWVASIVTMYADLRWLGEDLGGRSPGTWAIGGALMYPGVMLIYFFDRLRTLVG